MRRNYVLELHGRCRMARNGTSRVQNFDGRSSLSDWSDGECGPSARLGYWIETPHNHATPAAGCLSPGVGQQDGKPRGSQLEQLAWRFLAMALDTLHCPSTAARKDGQRHAARRFRSRVNKATTR
jgi:hypothetical protein